MQCPPKNQKILYYILLFAILFFHSIFYYTIIKANFNVLILLIPHISFTLFIFLHIYKIKKAKNKVPEINDNYAMVNDLEYCSKCNNYKPERAHHCSTCGKCIIKMDHHCVFLNKCIGSENLADFIRLAFFATISFIFMSISTGYTLYEFKELFPILDNSKKKFTVFILFTLILIMGMCGAYICYFTGYHIYGAAMNLTFLEREVLDEMKRIGYECGRNPYDLGVIKNIKMILGKWYFLFLYGENKEGVNFLKTYFITKWPPLKIQELWRM